MGNKGKDNSSLLSTVKSLVVSIFGGNEKTSKSAAEPAGGPVATMVAASKHFSSPHKKFVGGTIGLKAVTRQGLRA
ncbi:hypothetical protein VNO78_09406 [Psophocarpus tetragonolobus]|uniref:Uncharacterized protein n=1 Tax=Psophocarpus tetragonolobus TaxID=3891 RepID=A0AAN9SW52_PSOTE